MHHLVKPLKEVILKFSFPKNPKNVRPYFSNCIKKCDPIQQHIPSNLLLGSTYPPSTDASGAIELSLIAQPCIAQP